MRQKCGREVRVLGVARKARKCENILVLTFVLAGELTDLALIFGAKSLVRCEEIHTDAGYYLWRHAREPGLVAAAGASW